MRQAHADVSESERNARVISDLVVSGSALTSTRAVEEYHRRDEANAPL
jgi:hypothetical protein